jgi:hypothetical protein
MSIAYLNTMPKKLKTKSTLISRDNLISIGYAKLKVLNYEINKIYMYGRFPNTIIILDYESLLMIFYFPQEYNNSNRNRVAIKRKYGLGIAGQDEFPGLSEEEWIKTMIKDSFEWRLEVYQTLPKKLHEIFFMTDATFSCYIPKVAFKLDVFASSRNNVYYFTTNNIKGFITKKDRNIIASTIWSSNDNIEQDVWMASKDDKKLISIARDILSSYQYLFTKLEDIKKDNISKSIKQHPKYQELTRDELEVLFEKRMK